MRTRVRTVGERDAAAGASVKSAARVLDILSYVAARAPRTFAEIAASLKIPNSSLYYLLSTLSQRRYLVLDSLSRGYSLGPAARRLGAAETEAGDRFPLLNQIVEDASLAVNETATYMERRGDEIECLIRCLGKHPLIPVVRTGVCAPLYTFSGGKVILAQLSDDALDDYIRRTRFRKLTANTVASGAGLRKELRQVRASGFGMSREEHTMGIIGLSIGLFVAGRLIGTLGFAVPTTRFDQKLVSAMKAELRRGAQTFSVQVDVG